MPKSGKQNNDLRGVRKGTAVGIALSGAVCIAASTLAAAKFELDALRC